MGFKEQPEILISKHESEVQKFYNGKSILITGAAGFLGKVILEILLRCCPGIIRIYILLRTKNGLQPEERKENIFKRELFHKLVQENPDVLNKVHLVSGDVSLNNLGMCEKDSHRITEEVSIVFHVAASISFFRPISFLIDQNVVGTYNVIDLCKKLKTLEALVYTSTMYSNSNRKHEIDEIVYKLPFKAEEAARLSKNGNVDALNHLFSKCNPNFLNYYTFSKCVAENLLAEKAKDLPVCIVRPSLIINCLKGALPGYIEDGSALVNMAEGKRLHKSARDEGRMFHTKPRKKEHYTLVKEPFSQYIGYVSVATGEVKAIKKVGKGLIQVVKVYGKNKIDFVPADIAANTHIIAAFLQATKSMTSPSVYNCTSAVKSHTWEDLSVSLSNTLAKHPLPNSYIRPRIIICSSSFLYKFLILIFHFIPATIADAYLWIARKKFRLLKLYKFQERLFGETEPFLKRQWDFRCENFVSLPEKLNETDAKIFNADMKEFDMEKWKSSFYTGCPQYRVNGKLYEDTLTACFLRYFLTYLHKCFLLGSMAVLCYFVFLLYQVLMNVIS